MKAPWDDVDVEFPVTVRIHYTLYNEDIDELTDEYEDVEAWAGLSEYDSSDDARDYAIEEAVREAEKEFYRDHCDEEVDIIESVAL